MNHTLINAGFSLKDIDEMTDEEYLFHYAYQNEKENAKAKTKQKSFGGI